MSKASEIINLDAYRIEIDLSTRVEIDLTLDDEPGVSNPSPLHRLSSSRQQFKHESPHPTLPTRNGPPSSLSPGIADRTTQKRRITELKKDGPDIKKRRVSGTHSPGAAPSMTTLKTAVSSQNHPNVPYSSISASSTSLRHDQRKRGAIIVIDDSEEEPSNGHYTKKGKQSDPSDSDEEYDTVHDGLNPHNPHNWKPFKEHNHNQDALVDSMKQLLVDPTPSRSARRFPNISNRPSPSTPTSPQILKPHHIWAALRMVEGLSSPKPSQMCHSITTRGLSTAHRPPLQKALQLDELNITDSFRKAPGSINKIAQRKGVVVICSAAVGGQPDTDDEEPDLYNRDGSLIVWRNGNAQVVNGHNRKNQGPFEKYYTVNDIAFDPCCPTTMVSSGNDKKVRVWALDDNSDQRLRLKHKISYKYVPNDLIFKPGDSILAVTSQNGKIYVYPDLSYPKPPKISLNVAPPEDSDHATGTAVWGHEGTSGFLFASSEPVDDGAPGFHRAFDMSTQQLAYDFDAKECGDAMTVNANGENLALFTRSADGSHFLRMYDIRRKDGHAISTINLNRIPIHYNKDGKIGSLGEVNCAAFSSDSIYLAVARSDNLTHVYDSRMLGKGVLHSLKHHPGTGPGSLSYGIVKAQWVESTSRRLGLVTGGDDGCVRIWDISKSAGDPGNGTVLAETSFDVGYFSLGDPFQGERTLVVGDCGGGVSIFDRRGGPW